MSPLRRTARLAVAFLIAVPAAAIAPTPAVADNPRQLTVMTRNLYLGTDLTPIVTAPSVPLLFQRVAEGFLQVQASNFPERAEAIADEIRDAGPALVGLQEVSLWRTDAPADGPASPAETIAYDFLAILMGELAERGLSYDVVATTTSFDAELPSALGVDVRLTDRDVILARTELPTSHLKISNVVERNFETALTLPTPIPGVSFTALRGWNSVDVKWRGKSFTFVNTHLEAFSGPVQVAQGNELLAAIAGSPHPVILVGDLNSAADGSSTPTYANVVAASFADSWSAVHPGAPGYTCCQAPHLLNPVSLLHERIDLIMFRGAVGAVSSEVVGDEPADRTLSGRWPSDHAGVVSTLRILP